MTYTERAHSFACEGEMLTGILSVPESPGRLGVVIVVGGPQYRVGSHRQFVLLARSLARAGYATLRFDYRGMGDCSGDARDFNSVTMDIAAAITLLQQAVPGVEHIALWGLCDAASAALMYVGETRDGRVGGLCLLNPWVRSEASLARAHVKHYYRDRLRQKEFWLKLLRGGVATAALKGLWRNMRLMAGTPSATGQAGAAPFQLRMASAWKHYAGSILLVLSGQDYTAKEFLEHAGSDTQWSGLLAQAKVLRADVPDADHTFSSQRLRAQVEEATVSWLGTLGRH